MRARSLACSCPAGLMGAPLDPWIRFSRFQSVSPWRTNTKSRVREAVALDPARMGEKLRVQDGRARGAADGVVAQGVELPVQDRTGTQPSHGDAHARGAIHVQTRLRPVQLRADLDRIARRGGEHEPLERTEFAEGREQALLRGLGL